MSLIILPPTETYEQLCVHADCGKRGHLRCYHCNGKPGPKFDGTTLDYYYCDAVHASRHWAQGHRPECFAARMRQALLIMAERFVECYVTKREDTWDSPVTGFERNKGILKYHTSYQESNIRRKRRAGGMVWELPKSFKELPVAHRRAIAYHDHHDEAVLSLGNAVIWGLHLKDKELHVYRFHIKNPSLVVNEVRDGVETPPQTVHTVLAVHLPCNDEAPYVIDFAGAQHGFNDLIVPLDKYMEDHAQRGISSCSFIDFLRRSEAALDDLKPSNDMLSTNRRVYEYLFPFISARDPPTKDIHNNGEEDAYRESIDRFAKSFNSAVRKAFF